MVEKTLKKNINLSNKLFYLIIVFGISLAIGAGVSAYGTTEPAIFGHSAGEIEGGTGSGDGDFTGGDGDSMTGDIKLQPATKGGTTSIVFGSKVNAGSDRGYIVWDDDDDSYNYWGNSDENGAFIIGTENDKQVTASDVLVLKGKAANIFDSQSNLFVNGNVGIGTGLRHPNSKLEIFEGSLRLPSSEYEGAGQIQSISTIRFANGNSAQGIYAKQISISDSWANNDANTQTNGLYVKGNALIGGTVTAKSFIYDSDRRLKENIQIIPNALEKVKKLKGVSFEWIADETNDKNLGLIAQDVEKVLPEVVSTNENGLKAVEYGNIVAVLVEAIKEQQKEIEELKLKLDN
jgi:hypothetical protein